MKLYLNDTTETNNKQIVEVNKTACITADGYDPVKFVDPYAQMAGNLGLSIRKEYDCAPLFDSESDGTLDELKFYAIRLAPVSTYVSDPNSGAFLQGPAMHWSDPVMPSAALKSLEFTLPCEPTDALVFHAGTIDSGSGVTVTDDDADYVDDALVDYFLLNVKTGELSLITGNNSTDITTSDDINLGADIRYQVIKPKVTDYYVYATELSAAGLVIGATWVYQGRVDVAETSYSLRSFVGTGTPLLDVYFPPEPQSSCAEADGRLFLGGGIYDIDGGAAKVDMYSQTFSAIAGAGNTITAESTFQTALVYGESVLSQIMRFTIPTNSSDIKRAQIGSFVTITGSEDSDNDCSEVMITNVDPDGRWFEIPLNNGIANADDETMSMTLVRNVLVGNTTGEGITSFTAGMVGGRLKFESDARSFGIRWVDPVTQQVGLTEPYTGLSVIELVDDNQPEYAIDCIQDNSSNRNIGFCMAGEEVIDLTSTPDFTISFWARRITNYSNVDYLFVLGGLVSGFGDHFGLRYHSLEDEYQIAYNFPLQYKYYGNTDGRMPVNEWHHFAVSVETDAANFMQLYIDGVAQQATFNNGSPTAWTAPQSDTHLKLGQGDTSANWSKIKIYDSALSATEAMDDYLGKDVNGILKRWDGDENTGDFYNEASGGVDLYYSDTSYFDIPTPTTPAVWSEFGQIVEVENDDEFSVARELGVSWSDVSQPNIFRTENYIDIPDTVRWVESFGGMMMVGCENSMYKLNLQGLGQTPILVSNDVKCTAPNGKVTTPVGLFFYDGSGISMTDGQQVVPVTAYRAHTYLSNINNNMEQNIRAIYNTEKRQVEFVFPFGSDTENNYGITISIDSMNCYPTYRLNCNAMWIQRDEFGDIQTYHGTTARLSDSKVIKHNSDLGTDGRWGIELSGVIANVDGNTLRVDFGVELNGDGSVDDEVVAAGDIACIFPSIKTQYRQAAIESIVRSDAGFQTDISNYYDITFDPDADLTDITQDGLIIMGGIPFDYGIKWTDFTSPQYSKKVRELQLDVTKFNGLLYVEHYKDLLSNGPFAVNMHHINADDTKIIDTVKSGDLKSYGFRVYGISLTRLTFHSFETLFDVEQ